MRIEEAKIMKFRFKAALLAMAVCFCGLALSGCGGTAYDDIASEKNEEIGFQEYKEEADEGVTEEDTDSASEGGSGSADEEEGEDASSADGQEKILVYEGTVSIDTMEFEGTVRAFKAAVGEYGGFLEGEQSYGTGGRYEEESFYSAEDPRTFMAIARIPSEKYQDFMAKAEGLGNVTESSSRVTNMTRQYGTLKAELEIYEAEYRRYLKMFDEVSDDNAMIAIQEKLTELSLDIARTKSEMAAIDTDATYSTVEVHIQEVAAYRENGAGFPERLGNVLAKSWEGMLGFFEGLLFFFIMHWYKLLLLLLIVFFVIRFVKKYEEKNRQKKQQAVQAYQQGMQGKQGAQMQRGQNCQETHQQGMQGMQMQGNQKEEARGVKVRQEEEVQAEADKEADFKKAEEMEKNE